MKTECKIISIEDYLCDKLEHHMVQMHEFYEKDYYEEAEEHRLEAEFIASKLEYLKTTNG